MYGTRLILVSRHRKKNTTSTLSREPDPERAFGISQIDVDKTSGLIGMFLNPGHKLINGAQAAKTLLSKVFDLIVTHFEQDDSVAVSTHGRREQAAVLACNDHGTKKMSAPDG